MSKCDGECAKFNECRGEVRRYKITGGHWDGLEFNYCEIAAAYDRHHGMNLEPIQEASDES
jgi:hypothetical protein